MPELLRDTANQFISNYCINVQTFEDENKAAPGVAVKLTGAHTTEHCVVYVTSCGERLTCAGDALFLSRSNTLIGTIALSMTLTSQYLFGCA